MTGLSLPLLETGILLVDHEQFTLATHDLAIDTALLDGCSYFHMLSFLAPAASLPVRLCLLLCYLYLKMILPRDRSYGLISTPTLSPGSIRI